MDPKKIAELEASVTAAEQAAADAGGTDETLNKAAADAKAALAQAKAPSQGSKYTEKEKATHALKANAERARELGLDPADILGTKTHIETDQGDDDAKPVTVGMLRDIQKKDAQNTAVQMADTITDQETRDLVKQYLADRIKPSGDADADFRLALAAASAAKNKQVREMVERHVPAKRTAAGGSSPARTDEEFVPTTDEQMFMKHPYNLTKEKIIAARKAAQAKNS
jgi:hypothetical protein